MFSTNTPPDIEKTNSVINYVKSMQEEINALRRENAQLKAELTALKNTDPKATLQLGGNPQCFFSSQNKQDDEKLNEQLLLAMIHCDQYAVGRWLENGANPNCRTNDGMTPLMSLNFSPNSTSTLIEIAGLLVNYGANINEGNVSSGHTALHYAALKEKLFFIDFLLKNGADPLIKDHALKTPKERYLYQREIYNDRINREIVDKLEAAENKLKLGL